MKVFLGVTEEKLGDVMRRYRTEHNYTQQRIADYLGIDRTTYSKYETVRKPELEVIMKLTALYNVSVDEFLKEFFDIRTDTPTSSFATASSDNGDEELLAVNDEEKQLLLFYRESIRKKEMLEKAREIWSGDAQIRKSEK